MSTSAIVLASSTLTLLLCLALIATATGAAQAVEAAIGPGTQPPQRAWTIVGVNWEYNDEFCYEAGEFVGSKVYFDESEAKAECRKLCDAFFSESPQDFQPCWDAFDVDPDTGTWDDLRKAGFSDPYSVKELEV